jgi:hypothetical protein
MVALRIATIIIATCCFPCILQRGGGTADAAFVGAFAIRTTFFGGHNPRTMRRLRQQRHNVQKSQWSMRDSSASYWFQVNDRVRVMDDVYKSNIGNLRDWEGRVVQTWEKCEVDPTCCCAEQVDINMAVQVEFTISNSSSNTTSSSSNSGTNETFTHYFAESELWKT